MRENEYKDHSAGEMADTAFRLRKHSVKEDWAYHKAGAIHSILNNNSFQLYSCLDWYERLEELFGVAVRASNWSVFYYFIKYLFR